MIPARSVAASVVALGFAGTMTAPIPAFAAPAECGHPQHYGAQSSAELLRIDRLDLGPKAGVTNRRGSAPDEPSATHRADSASPGTASPGTGSGGSGTGTSSGTAGADPHSGTAISGPAPGGASGEGGGSGGSGGHVPGLDQEHQGRTLPAWKQSPGGRGGEQDRKSSRGQGGRQGGGQGGASSEGPGAGRFGGQGGGQGGVSGTGPGGDRHGERGGAGVVAISGFGDTVLGGVGLGDARSVLIADGPVNSAGAARTLNGRVTGSTERNDLVVQQAPPIQAKGNERRTGSKRFGPVKVGDGSLSARATWAHRSACGSAGGDTSTAAAEISRVTIAGGGSGSLVRVPERISSRSGTALRLRGGSAQSVASATITAGRISLVDNEVRIRVLRAPELRVSMTADGQGRVSYQPAVVEVSGKDGTRARLATPGDHVDITLSDELRPLESLPSTLEPVAAPPLPKVPGLPPVGEPETTSTPSPAPGAKSGKDSASRLRITLGDARQATSGNAIAARATAIRVTVVRNADKGHTGGASPASDVVADLGIGMLDAAAIAPSGVRTGSADPDDVQGRAGSGSETSGAGRPGVGSVAGGAALPITGPRVVSLFLAGVGLVIGGICAVVLTSRRRRDNS